MPDAIILRRKGRQIYNWNRYNRVTTVTYTWNRYNLNSTTTYIWNRYNLNTSYSYQLQASGTTTWYILFNRAVFTSVYASSPNTISGNGATTVQGIIGYGNDTSGLIGYWVINNDPYRADTALQISSARRVNNTQLTVTGTLYEQVSIPQYSAGSAAGTVSSTNRSAYPDNSYSGSYWYVYSNSNITYSQGSANGTVSSTNRSAYPDNSYSGSYWYVYSRSTTTYSQGTAAGTVTSTNRNTYPDNNYSGNYWYVYTGTNIVGRRKRILAK